jgi:predicted alpha/beta superfamily hydrolase
MRRTILFLVSALFSFSFLSAQDNVRFEIKSLPAYHGSGSSIYMAGSFNNWNPQDEQFKFKQDDKGNYFLVLRLDPGKYQYKLTRGGWESVECKKGGAGIDNRIMTIPVAAAVELSVEEWTDRFPPKSKTSTASKNVRIIDTAFWIPQLNRTRRVWIYLPESYNNSGKSRFPVLYLHDGQNVFDDSTSFSGEWGVDEFMDTVSVQRSIIVAIDHGGAKRINEYCPYDMERFGKGEGDGYVDFLARTLKPFIDRNYRTSRKKKNTMLAGSSMGGLISMYALVKYPRVFGGAGVFSPAFWVGKKILDDIRAKGKKIKSKIYFYAGKQEGESMVPDMLTVLEEMGKVSKSTMRTVIRDDGKHNEPTWRTEFPLFYNWVISRHP